MVRVYKQTCAVIPTSHHPPHQCQFPNYPHTLTKAATKMGRDDCSGSGGDGLSARMKLDDSNYIISK